MGKTGTWIWPGRDSNSKIINVEASDIAYIKSLLVGWDATNLGAPAFLTKEGDWLHATFESDPKKKSLLSLFINQATLDKNVTIYNNPLVDENLEESVKNEILNKFPSKEIKALLLTEKTIEVDVNNVLRKLWNTSGLGAEGFSQKRGFKLANLQDVIDPEKKLSRGEITKEKKYYKGLLFLYLQLFIKEATLETGFYHSEDNCNWEKGREFNIAEEINNGCWGENIGEDLYNEMEYYNGLMSLLPSLKPYLEAKESIDYQKIVEIFNLKLFFRYDAKPNYKSNTIIERIDIQLEEILLKALEYFPEEKRVTENQESYTYLLLLVRIYNAQGRFSEAQKLLQENNLDLYTENQQEFFSTLPNIYQQVAFYESCICRMDLTGNYNLWKFPDSPLLVGNDFKKVGGNGNEHLSSERIEEINKKINHSIEEQSTLLYDIRPYLNLAYNRINFNLDFIYEDLRRTCEIKIPYASNKRDYKILFIATSMIAQIKCMYLFESE